MEEMFRSVFWNGRSLHPSDKAKAREAFCEAVNEKVDFDEFVEVARTFLTEKGCSPEHIKKEIKKVKELKSYFG